MLVTHDLLGLYPKQAPSFAKAYARLGEEAGSAIAAFKREVEAGKFPDREHYHSMDAKELEKLKR